MTTRERRKEKYYRRKSPAQSSRYTEMNPMDSLSNLADVMLVLAVGFMLALILHWNLPLTQDGNHGSTSETVQKSDSEKKEPILSLDRNDLTKTTGIPENSERVGSVFYDEQSGTWYILQE